MIFFVSRGLFFHVIFNLRPSSDKAAEKPEDLVNEHRATVCSLKTASKTSCVLCVLGKSGLLSTPVSENSLFSSREPEGGVGWGIGGAQAAGRGGGTHLGGPLSSGLQRPAVHCTRWPAGGSKGPSSNRPCSFSSSWEYRVLMTGCLFFRFKQTSEEPATVVKGEFL